MSNFSKCHLWILILTLLSFKSVGQSDYEIIFDQQEPSEPNTIQFEILFQSTDLWFQADIGVYNNILDDQSMFAGTLEAFEINPLLSETGNVSYSTVYFSNDFYYHYLQLERTSEVNLDTPILLATISINTSNYDPNIQYYTDASSYLTTAYSDPESNIEMERVSDALFGTFFTIPGPATFSIIFLLNIKSRRRTSF